MSCAEYGVESAPSCYPRSSRSTKGNSKNGHRGNIKGNALAATENNGDIKEITTQGQGKSQKQPPCTWEGDLSKEIVSYKNPAKGAYHPQRFSLEQLRKAASEFYKR